MKELCKALEVIRLNESKLSNKDRSDVLLNLRDALESKAIPTIGGEKSSEFMKTIIIARANIPAARKVIEANKVAASIKDHNVCAVITVA